MTPEERQELCALYVLGALEPQEMAAIDAPIQTGDREVIHDVTAFRETVDLLPHALAPVPPNPVVRSRLMHRLQAVAPEAKTPPAVSPSGGFLAWLRVSLVWLPTTAAVALALLLSWFIHDFRRQIVHLETEVQHLRDVAMAHQRLVSVLSLPNVKIVMLGGTEHATQASARLIWDTDRREWTVVTHDLPPLAPGKVYQLWFLTAEQPLPSHTFQTDARGIGVVQAKLPSKPTTIAGAAVSLEPEGGVAQPTGDIVLVGKF
jgi:anti-sigma-K factor RskA